MARGRLLTMFAGAGLAVVAAGCRSDNKSSGTSAAASSSTATVGTTATAVTTAVAATSGLLDAVPEETGGPYPGDGSNGPNVLSGSGIVRSNIRSSFGTSTTTADGVPATISLTLVDSSTGAPLPGAAVYLWHCDAEGRYSLYSRGVTNETICAVCKRPTEVVSLPSPASFRRAIPAAGRISTTRSIRHSTMRRRRRTSW